MLVPCEENLFTGIAYAVLRWGLFWICRQHVKEQPKKVLRNVCIDVRWNSDSIMPLLASFYECYPSTEYTLKMVGCKLLIQSIICRQVPQFVVLVSKKLIEIRPTFPMILTFLVINQY
jgi:hypothetical protein